MSIDRFKQVSEAPTRPSEKGGKRKFDVADLYRGPVERADAASRSDVSLDEKLRQAYFWIVNHGIISPYYDIEYNDEPPQRFQFGDRKVEVTLPTDQSYSSYVLLPLLNLAVRRRCLLVGGPGRGKTAIAILMGILSGYTLRDVKRGIQHGQPQMTIADLLGNPLPSSMVDAKSMDDIVIAWRKWLGMRVKIIDEYNRIPTRTQSALLTVMGDNYAEIYDQIFECPPAAWYLTANDDAGGGTYQVIEALRDRIDVVVKALHFNTRFLDELLTRIEEGIRPEEIVPDAIVFAADELEQMEAEIRAVTIEPPLRRRLEFFASHFEFFEPGARQVEYMTKDTVKISGVDFLSFAHDDTGKDALADLGTQTRNGLSVRALMTALIYVKAMAYFRGAREASFEDVRQILPFVLHDKLAQNRDAAYFEQTGNDALRADHVSWIRNLFELSCREYDRLNLDRDDPVAEIAAQFEKGLDGVPADEVRSRLVEIERTLREWESGRKFYGHMFDDVLKMKYFHQRYTNYLSWLEWDEVIHEAFAEELERGRDGYNARFAFARRQSRNLEADDFFGHLRVCVDPIVVSVTESGATAEELRGVVRALYDLSLDLVGRDLAGPGARFPVISRMWAELLPLVPAFIVAAPHDIAAALTNAVYNLSVEPTVESQTWLDAMLDVADEPETTDELLAVGQVLSWTHGMAHYRDGALHVWRALRDELKEATLGVVEYDGKRWSRPGTAAAEPIELVARVGGFRGFGGNFIRPPKVTAVDGHLYVTDDERCWTIHADVFGATLKPFGTELPSGDAAPTRWSVGKGRVSHGEASLQNPEVERPTSWAATADTLAVSVEHSHEIVLFSGGR